MYIAYSCFFVIFITFLNGYTSAQDLSECENVNAKFFITTGIPTSRFQQLKEILLSVVEKLPEGSKVDLNIVSGQKITKIGNVTVPDDTGILFDALWKNLNSPYVSRSAGKISSAAVDDDVLSDFPYNHYRCVSELVFWFVDQSSPLFFDKLPNSLLKKKTTVVSFGDLGAEQWQVVASRQDHLLVVDSTADLHHISNALTASICQDSKFYCDTDEFSLMQGAACDSCSDPCYRSDSLTCLRRCPYYRKPVPESKLNVPVNGSKEKEDVSKEGVHDNKYQALEASVIIICGLLVTPLGVLMYQRLNTQSATLHQDIEMQELPPRNRGGEPQNRQPHNMPLIPDSVAQLESQGATGGRPDQADADFAEFLLKNEREREMNELATGDPSIIDIHPDK